MKKIFNASLLLAALSLGFASCLKDKGFENYEYGINDPDTQAPGVGFSFGTSAKVDFGLDVSTSPQTVTGLTNVNMLTGVVPSSDVNVTITNNTTALLNAYNTANGTSILPMPTALYTIGSTLTIAAGQRFNDLPIVVSNTTTLDPNRQYAVGLTISAVNGGYTIAGNMKNLLIVFGVKNAYDGKYTMRGRFFHPSLQPDFGPHTFNVELHTAGPSSVRLYWPLAGGFFTPLTSGGGPACCFASQTLGISVNTANNQAVAFNADPAGLIYDPVRSWNGNSYSAAAQRWDPATKTFYLAWGYNLPAGGNLPNPPVNPVRCWIDTLIRTGPR